VPDIATFPVYAFPHRTKKKLSVTGSVK